MYTSWTLTTNMNSTYSVIKNGYYSTTTYNGLSKNDDYGVEDQKRKASALRQHPSRMKTNEPKHKQGLPEI